MRNWIIDLLVLDELCCSIHNIPCTLCIAINRGCIAGLKASLEYNDGIITIIMQIVCRLGNTKSSL